MTGFIIGADRTQGTMFPAQLEDYTLFTPGSEISPG